MSAVTGNRAFDRRDPALRLAIRYLGAERAMRRHEQASQQAEQALAEVARGADLALTIASRSSHPHAMRQRQCARRAARHRRTRDRLASALVVTAATTPAGMRAKVLVALLHIDDVRAAALLRSLVLDLRRQTSDAH